MDGHSGTILHNGLMIMQEFNASIRRHILQFGVIIQPLVVQAVKENQEQRQHAVMGIVKSLPTLMVLLNQIKTRRDQGEVIQWLFMKHQPKMQFIK